MSPNILVPIDDSATSARCVDYLLANRERFPATLVLLHVVNIDKLAYRMIPDFQLKMIRERARQSGAEFLAGQARRLAEAGLSVAERLEEGNPREVIPRVANAEPFELLVIGRSHMGEIRDVLFGSVTNYVLHQVTCPVLLV